MSFESFIARRYLATRRKPLFASFILLISVSAIAVGVFALIFVLSIMNGFEQDFRQRIIGFKAPILVESIDHDDLSSEIDSWKRLDRRISKVVPFVEGEAVAQTPEGGALGVRVRGIGEAPAENRLSRYYESEPFSETSLVMGEELAANLQAYPERAEEIRLIFPIGDVGPTGDLIPRVRSLTLTGVFRSGFFDFDSKYVLIDYRQALRLFGREGRTGLEVWVHSPGDVEAVRKSLESKVLENPDRWRLQTWRDQNPKLFAAMKLEKIGMFLLLGMLLLIASFNIYGLTSLTVLDKMKDMAVLRASGLSLKRVLKVFLTQASLIGVLGSSVGGALGLIVTWLLQRYPVPLPTTYYLESLPVQVEGSDVLAIVLLIPIVTTIASLYPAFQASRVSPIEALRYE